MAIEQHILNRLKKLAPCKLLSLGYPDLLVNEYVAHALDEKHVANWHGWNGSVADTESLFRSYGIEATYIDIHASRKVERIVDLNQPLPMDLCGQFDVVIDPGTIEHCFNVAQAFQNLMMACKVGGRVIHTNPINMINHGFWSISPTTYADLYSQNGWQIEELSAFGGDINQRSFCEVPTYSRFAAPLEISSLVVAKKITEQTFMMPTQRKYQVNPELKHAS